MKKYIAIWSLIFIMSEIVCASEHGDSITYKNCIKFDFVPLYNVFFDSQVQIKGGIEYERVLNPKFSFINYVDAGLYNVYDYYKYYDFFNENGGMYYIKQHISISGFHEMPGINYKLFQLKKRPRWSLFTGAMADFSYYLKQFHINNNKTGEQYTDSYHQLRIGMGLSGGIMFKVSRCFFIEAKTSIFTSLYKHISKENVNPMMSYNAQWTSPNYKFWWSSNVKIAYVF